jgi:hypothetical protein
LNKKINESGKKTKFFGGFRIWGIAAVSGIAATFFVFREFRHCNCEPWSLFGKDPAVVICSKTETEGETETRREINLLKQEIIRLDKEIGLLRETPSGESARRPTEDRNKLRQKWKTWMLLRSKIEADDSFEEEMHKFKELFARDKELIKLVDELTDGINVISNGKPMEICGNVLRKIVRFKKVNRRKMAEISGYVLSSICDCSEKEKKSDESSDLQNIKPGIH